MVEGFVAWYEREHERVFASLCALSGDADAAADATDEAFARAYLHWDRVAAMASPGGWTYRVALHALRTAMRRGRRRRDAEQRAAASFVAPEDDIELWAVVATLPERQRTAVVLRYVADLTEADIATAMSVRRGTVAATLHQARLRLAEALRDDDTDHALRSEHG